MRTSVVIIAAILTIAVVVTIPMRWNRSRVRWPLWGLAMNGFRKASIMYGGSCLNRKVCLANLETFDDVMKKHGLKFWLSEGTALGARREGNFIAHDDDVDVAVEYGLFDSFISDGAFRDLTLAGFRLLKVWNDGRFMTFMRYNETLDIDFVENGTFCMFLSRGKYGFEGTCANVDDYVSHLHPVSFHGRQYLIPEDNYFVYMYGDGWMKPDKTSTRCNNNPYE